MRHIAAAVRKAHRDIYLRSGRCDCCHFCRRGQDHSSHRHVRRRKDEPVALHVPSGWRAP